MKAGPILCFSEVTSTMDVARSCLARRTHGGAIDPAVPALSEQQATDLNAALDAQSPFAVLAARQQAGRGTAGRSWQSPPGNMYCTFVLPLALAPTENASARTPAVIPRVSQSLLPVLPLACGLSVRETLLACFPSLAPKSVTCKWPNDLLLDAKKVGGILIEGEGAAVLIGVGINLAHAPPVADGGRPSTSVLDHLGAAQGTARPAAEVHLDRLALPHTVAQTLMRTLGAHLIRFETLPAATDEARRRVIVNAFEAVMDRTQVVYRRLSNGQRAPEPLHPIKLTSWGLLVVRTESGQEEELVADYLY